MKVGFGPQRQGAVVRAPVGFGSGKAARMSRGHPCAGGIWLSGGGKDGGDGGVRRWDLLFVHPKSRISASGVDPKEPIELLRIATAFHGLAPGSLHIFKKCFSGGFGIPAPNWFRYELSGSSMWALQFEAYSV